MASGTVKGTMKKKEKEKKERDLDIIIWSHEAMSPLLCVLKGCIKAKNSK